MVQWMECQDIPLGHGRWKTISTKTCLSLFLFLAHKANYNKKTKAIYQIGKEYPPHKKKKKKQAIQENKGHLPYIILFPLPDMNMQTHPPPTSLPETHRYCLGNLSSGFTILVYLPKG